MRAFRVRFVLMTVALVSAVAGGGLRAETPPADLSGDPGARQRAAEQRFRKAYPRVSLLRQDRSIAGVYGSPFAFGETPLASAVEFCREHIEMFGVREDELRPLSLPAAIGHVQPLFYRPETDDFKFTLVSYSQTKDGFPVFRSDLRLLVRNEPGHPLVKATVSLSDLADFRITEGLRAELGSKSFVDARFAAARDEVLSKQPELTVFTAPEVVIWAGVDGQKELPRPALRFRGHNFGLGGAADQHWLFLADVETAEILFRESQIIHSDVIGNVSGMASAGIGADFCEPEIVMPMPHLRVTSGTGVGFSDENGDFVVPDGGSTVDASVRGRWFRIFNAQGVVATESEPSTFDLLFNEGNNSEQVRAQVNAYVEANRVRDLVARINPSYPTFTDTDIETNVNLTGGLCPGNAWYSPFDGSSPTGYSINFCLSGPTRPNTAFSSVVHHEFGHHLVRAGGSGQDQYGEGMGDVTSLLVLDSPLIGNGFFNSCSSSLRSADNAFQYPCSGESHFCGNLISGAVWDVRNKLVDSDPLDYRDVLANLAFNSILMHNGSNITPQIAIDYLTLDDDDGDLNNGTPHYDQINAGFSAHNMAAPPLQFGMGVLPPDDFTSSGPSGGPFLPDSAVYMLENFENIDISYSVLTNRPWLTVSNGIGVLEPGQTTVVTVSPNVAADELQGGLHTGIIQFMNNTTHIGDRTVAVELEIGQIRYQASGTPKTIPAFSTVTNTIDVPDSGCIGDLNVEVNISFQGIGALSVELESPSGAIVVLHEAGTDTSNNLVRTYDEEDGTVPDGPGSLSDFRTGDIQGSWILRMRSIGLGSSGTLNSWALDTSILGGTCPPQVQTINVEVPTATTSPIVLSATSLTGGGPLRFRIDSLPEHAVLTDPGGGGGAITAVPYMLSGTGNVVEYTPLNGYVGPDLFEYGADDGAPSIPAPVNVQSGVRQDAASFDFNSEPGWLTDGGWEFGPPGGGGDPTSAFSGTNVYGYNLGGDYPNNLGAENLTTGAIDCSGLVGVEASFERWLGVESSVFDKAAFQASRDGQSWTTIWKNGSQVLDENAWSRQVYDISQVADRQSTVYLRWVMGSTDSSETYPGWNIDDVLVQGVPAPPTIELTVDPGSLSWTALPGTSNYDVIRGTLSVLHGTGGDFQSATDACLGNNLGTTSLTETDPPAMGDGFWFLVRGDSAPAVRTYDSFYPSQSDVRDAEIESASATCP